MFEISLPVYWICLGVGTLLLLLAVLLGDLFDGLLEGFGFDVDLAGGGLLAPILAFISLFGAGGLIGQSYLPGLPSMLVGIGFGLVGSAGAWWLFRGLRRAEAPGEQGIGRLVGSHGRVTVAIAPGGLGKVEVASRGTTDQYPAVAGTEIALGALVVVTAVAGSSLVVSVPTDRKSEE